MANSVTLRGYAAPFNEIGRVPVEDGEAELEYITEGAFDGMLGAERSVSVRVGHAGPIVATHVDLFADDYGLGFRARVDEGDWFAHLCLQMRANQFCSIFIEEAEHRDDNIDGRDVRCLTHIEGIEHIALTTDAAVYQGTGWWPDPDRLSGALPPRLAALAAHWQWVEMSPGGRG